MHLPSKPVRIGTVLTGKGVQWHAAPYLVFRVTLGEVECIFEELGEDWCLTDKLLARDVANSRIHHTELSIPICVALQVAIVRLLKCWSIKPTAVTSHSSGEIAAAYAVGALDLDQAMATASTAPPWRGK